MHTASLNQVRSGVSVQALAHFRDLLPLSDQSGFAPGALLQLERALYLHDQSSGIAQWLQSKRLPVPRQILKQLFRTRATDPRSACGKISRFEMQTNGPGFVCNIKLKLVWCAGHSFWGASIPRARIRMICKIEDGTYACIVEQEFGLDATKGFSVRHRRTSMLSKIAAPQMLAAPRAIYL